MRPSSFGLCEVSRTSRSRLCLAGLSAYAKRNFPGRASCSEGGGAFYSRFKRRLLASYAPFTFVYAPCALRVRSVYASVYIRVRSVYARVRSVYIRVTCDLHQACLRGLLVHRPSVKTRGRLSLRVITRRASLRRHGRGPSGLAGTGALCAGATTQHPRATTTPPPTLRPRTPRCSPAAAKSTPPMTSTTTQAFTSQLHHNYITTTQAFTSQLHHNYITTTPAFTSKLNAELHQPSTSRHHPPLVLLTVGHSVKFSCEIGLMIIKAPSNT